MSTTYRKHSLATLQPSRSIRRTAVRASTLLAVLVLPLMALSLTNPASAQMRSKLNFGVGAGFSKPVQAAGASLNTGWNFDVRGGLNAGRHLDTDLDFNYNHFGMNSSALALFGEPGGSVSAWSLAFQPTFHVLPRHSAANVYATGGFGLFRRNLSLTRPTVVTDLFCDPFFGCYPVSYGANQVVASFSTVKPGFNLGAGTEFHLHRRGPALFAEARYQRMFTNHGSDFSYVPVTFGVRW